MEKINKIIVNPLYKEKFERLQILEENREFCNHTMEHFIDVARIAYIINLEEDLGFDKELIYAAAMLHDIGRADEYDNGTPHNIAGSFIAKNILISTDLFSDEDIEIIVNAIKEHRSISVNRTDLGELICRADKLSRCCFNCKVSDKCNWSEDKKNNYLKV